jgi:hypothetical protein
MRTRLLTIALATLLVLSTGGTAVFADKDGKGRNDRSTSLTLYAVEGPSTFLTATGEEPEDEEYVPGPGDRLIIVEQLFTDEDREDDQVGRNDIECTFTAVDDDLIANLLCRGVLTLDDQGSLAWQGSTQFDLTEDPDEDEALIKVAITGGTGDFTRAGGEVVVFDTTEEDDDETTSTYEVTLFQLKAEKP